LILGRLNISVDARKHEPPRWLNVSDVAQNSNKAAMPSDEKTSVFLPTSHQAMLLKACLFEGDEAVSFWNDWRAATHLEKLDVGSFRLLPFLAVKMQSLGVQDPDLKNYLGLRRRTWIHNKLLFRTASTAVKQLKASRIPTLALKGIALASMYYESMSSRPMDDFDLLVRPTDALEAFDVLERHGWRVAADQLRPRVSIDLAVRTASTLENSPNPELQFDLHWQLFWARFSEEANRALWERAVALEIEGEQCLAPSAADMLLHVCAHGAMWNEIPPVRWVLDAALVVRSGVVDWTHLCAQSQRLGLVIPLVETLNYLCSIMRVPVPESVIQELKTNEVKSIDKLIYESRLKPPSQWSLLTVARLHNHIAWHEFVRSGQARNYLDYFGALRRGRGLNEVVSWVSQRAA
jgi:Uncharacterised nucleotidyltransferase